MKHSRNKKHVPLETDDFRMIAHELNEMPEFYKTLIEVDHNARLYLQRLRDKGYISFFDMIIHLDPHMIEVLFQTSNGRYAVMLADPASMKIASTPGWWDGGKL